MTAAEAPETRRRAELVLALAVGAVALAVRLVYLAQARAVPLFDVPLADARAYLEWARTISGGDTWSRAQGVFYQAPLYPYLLALVQAVAGEGGREADRTLELVRYLQAGFGAVSCALVASTARRLLGGGVGLAAGAASGLLLAVYPPALFFDGLVNKTSLAQLLLCLLLFLLVRRDGEAPGAGTTLAAGGVVALLALVRENALLLVPVLAGWTLLDRALGDARRRRRLALALAAGVAAVLLPVALRNLAVGGSFAVTTSQAGPNFYIGNRAGATGSYTPLRRGRSDPRFERRDAVELAEADVGRPLGAGEVSRYWLGRALDDIRADPLAWLRLLGRKAVMTVHRYEVPDVEDFYLFAERVGVLRWTAPWLHLGTLLPLAAAGLVLARPARRRLAPVLLVLATLAASVVAFYVFARYRYPVVPPLALLAGVGLALGADLGADLLRSDETRTRRRRLVPALAAATAAVAVAWLPTPWVLGGDPEAGRAMAHVNLGVALAEQGRRDEATAEYRRAAELDPRLVEARLNLGGSLLLTGRLDDALVHLRAAVELAPGDAEAWHQLGQARRAVAHARARPEALDDARHAFERALGLDPGFARAALDLAAVLDEQGHPKAARDILAAALDTARRRADETSAAALGRAIDRRQP